MDIIVLQASQQDAAEILSLQKRAYQSEAQLYDDWTIPPLLESLSEIEVEFETTLFLKAMNADAIIGSVRASLDSGTCRVGRLIVHPDYRRQGIGAMMMEKIETFFPSAKRFELFTGTRSTDNIRLYHKLGYRQFREEELSPKVRLVFYQKFARNAG